MSVITFPVIARKPRAVTAAPAAVISHPRSIGELAAEAVEKIESERCADMAMAEAHRLLELATLQLSELAKLHDRKTQAMTMMQLALERVRSSLA